MNKKFAGMWILLAILLTSFLAGNSAWGTVLDEDLDVKYGNNLIIICDARGGELERASVFPVIQGGLKIDKGRITSLSVYPSEFSGYSYLTLYQGKAKLACFLLGSSEAEKVVSLLTGSSARNCAKIRTTNCKLS